MFLPLVSVIIPVYNSQKYLYRCIESIREQLYINLEIIIIDDGSTDSSGKICDEYARIDSRIKVLHQKNMGAAGARNSGLKIMQGEYCCFVDADDSIDPQMILESVNAIRDSSADVVMFGHDEIFINGEVKTYIPIVYKDCFEGEEIHSFLLPEMIYLKSGSQNLWLSCSTNIYKTDILKASSFQFRSVQEIYSEDAFATLELFRNVNKAVILSECFYHYYQNSDSQSHTLNLDRYISIGNFYDESKKIYAQYQFGVAINERIPGMIASSLIGSLKVVAKSKDAHRYAKLKEIINVVSIQEALRELDVSGESLKRKIIINAIRNKKYSLCYMLAYIAR